MKRRMEGFQKPRPTTYSEVRVAMIREEAGWARCTCGWMTPPARAKVQDRAVDRHLSKHHGGQAIFT